MALLRSDEELKGARLEAARRSRAVDEQRGQVQKLQEKLQKEEEKTRSAVREKLSLSQELEELRSRHQVTGSNHRDSTIN